MLSASQKSHEKSLQQGLLWKACNDHSHSGYSWALPTSALGKRATGTGQTEPASGKWEFPKIGDANIVP